MNTRSALQSPVKKPNEDHDAINDIIGRLESRWRLGLTLRDQTWSPSRQPPSDPGKCFGLIKFLHFQGREILPQLLAEFNRIAGHKSARERLPYLRALLERGERVVRASSRQPSTTPTSNRVAPASPVSHYALRSGGPPVSSFLISGRNSNLGRTTTKSPLGSIQPSTPKRNDEKDPTPPPSPSLEASCRRQNKDIPQPSRKRSSEEFEDRANSKCSRGLSGKRKSSEFAAPGLPPTWKDTHDSRSSSRTSGTALSVAASATSATSTEVSRTDSVFSHYRDNTRSANTSFTTEATVSQSAPHFNSSGSISWDDQTKEDALQCLRQDEGLINPLEGLEIEIPEQSDVCISPGKPGEQHQLKNLPTQHLFVLEISEKLRNLPFKHRWEYVRVAQIVGSDPDDLIETRPGKAQDYENFWSRLMQNEACQDLSSTIQRSSQEAWEAANFENVKLKGSLSFNTSNTGPLFKLHMQALRTETSCRFQRAFGGDRFLYIEVPPLDALPSHLKEQHGYLLDRFVEWLAMPKQFLGRNWTVFFVDPLQPKKRKGESTEMRGFSVVLFAMNGCDLDRKTQKVSSRAPRQAMSSFDLLNWFMPFVDERNVSQPFPKAFARISLGLTTTTPTLSFKPSEVRYVQDIIADDTPEDDEFNDPALQWPKDRTKERRVMNDGCARISVGAAQQLWKNVGRGGPLPSTFQGRIGGAKGMWSISAASDTQNPNDREIWIEVTESQRKFWPHKDDYNDSLYDPQRLTFDLHSITDQASSSKIYLSFFPILLDRGVPEETLTGLIGRYMEQERTKLVESSEGPVSLRKWVNDQNSTKEERNREDDIPYQGAMPTSHHEKLVLLLESGFDTSCPYVSDIAEKFVSTSLQELRMNVRIPLPRCTYIKGVADPLGVLQPGEVHLCFSQSLTDEASGESINFLHGRSVLVARNPALRRSDIQKVKTTFRLELGHLRDVVVFPSKGKYPLAGKLQGGDYDGDTFWICWERDLVEPFRNAPAPLKDPTPAHYGIEVDRRKLREILPKESSFSIQTFLRASFEYRCKTNLLGQATKLHERLCYRENTIDSPKINALADLHDLLVDSAKNGYSFDEKAFDRFKKTSLCLRKHIKEPAYEKARKMDRPEKGKLAHGKELEMDYKKDNITDKMYFEAIEPHTKETFKVITDHFKSMQVDVDEDLLAPYHVIEEDGKENPEIAEELKQLEKAIKQVKDRWNAVIHGRDFDHPKQGESYTDSVNDCFAMFVAIRPTNLTHPVVKYWIRSMTSAPSDWELLKASALYKRWREKSLSFVFSMAGEWLCWIKASKAIDSRLLVLGMWANMKPRRVKKVIREGKKHRSDGYGVDDKDELFEVENDGTTA
ncbi:RNA dependent RNA polymerase-domain-containing protein [Phyllosticta citrichinensis]|uniref:RNA-dependent RNA polymerase n=1 Tax=Phyllosticta citrichinensis TaxID=1130410 RepID=A0ABR1Y7K9_9PEZI